MLAMHWALAMMFASCNIAYRIKSFDFSKKEQGDALGPSVELSGKQRDVSGPDLTTEPQWSIGWKYICMQKEFRHKSNSEKNPFCLVPLQAVGIASSDVVTVAINPSDCEESSAPELLKVCGFKGKHKRISYSSLKYAPKSAFLNAGQRDFNVKGGSTAQVGILEAALPVTFDTYEAKAWKKVLSAEQRAEFSVYHTTTTTTVTDVESRQEQPHRDIEEMAARAGAVNSEIFYSFKNDDFPHEDDEAEMVTVTTTTSTAITLLPGIDGVEALKKAIGNAGVQKKETVADAQELLDTLFGGLNDVHLVKGSHFDSAENKATVVLTSDASGELATKSKVPYQALADREMSARLEVKNGGAIVLHMVGLYFAPPPDTKDLFIEAMKYKSTAKSEKKKCLNECTPDDSDIDCESCVAYEWYKTHKAEVGKYTGKTAKILSATPFDMSALSMEQEQGAWMPSLVGDRNRRRIIYSMLAAAPARFHQFIFGSSPVDFNAPAETLNEKKKMAPTYKTGRYMAALSLPDFHGNAELESFFKENNLEEKSLEIGKRSLIGKLGTTYDYPMDMAESLGQGTSGINFARMVASASPVLHDQSIYVRPAKPSAVMKMLGLCDEAVDNEGKIDTGCSGNGGRILWRPV